MQGQLIRLEVQLLDDGDVSMDHIWYSCWLIEDLRILVARHWFENWLEQNQPTLVLLATVAAIFAGLWFLSQPSHPPPPTPEAHGPLGGHHAGSDAFTPSRSARWEPGPDSIARPTPPSASRYDVRSAGGYGTPGYENAQSPIQPIFSRRA